jgi:glycosyltransferase involved in cell wall biosynthesis
MSVTVIEGFMNKKITIVTEIAGVAKFVKDGVNGFIMRSENSDDLARIMMHIMDSDSAKLGNIGLEARRTFDEFFSIETYDARLEEVFGVSQMPNNI